MDLRGHNKFLQNPDTLLVFPRQQASAGICEEYAPGKIMEPFIKEIGQLFPNGPIQGLVEFNLFT
jgi:hypothetical protein